MTRGYIKRGKILCETGIDEWGVLDIFSRRGVVLLETDNKGASNILNRKMMSRTTFGRFQLLGLYILTSFIPISSSSIVGGSFNI